MTTPIPLALGENLDLDLTITLSGAGAIAGALILFTIKSSLDDEDTAALMRKETGSGITVLNEAAGRARISITRTESATLPPGRILPFDVKLVPAEPEKATIVYEGWIHTRRTPTRRTAKL